MASGQVVAFALSCEQSKLPSGAAHSAVRRQSWQVIMTLSWLLHMDSHLDVSVAYFTSGWHLSLKMISCEIECHVSLPYTSNRPLPVAFPELFDEHAASRDGSETMMLEDLLEGLG